MHNEKFRSRVSEEGFSLLELLVVLAIIAVLTTISIFYLAGHKQLYKPDDEALLINDILQEARQRSITQRETLRVEINRTRNTVTLYDENEGATADDDRVLKSMAMFDQTEVRVGTAPANIAPNPPEPLPVPTSAFAPSVYPASISDTVCTLRFLANGQVVNAGNNAVGTGAVATGATIHIFAPAKDIPANATIARALTVIGSTGTIRLWEWDYSSVDANKWKDSRRSGSFGG
jgi:prepilin-type N-terminal cleavage/methylation domain-containing protein